MFSHHRADHLPFGRHRRPPGPKAHRESGPRGHRERPQSSGFRRPPAAAGFRNRRGSPTGALAPPSSVRLAGRPHSITLRSLPRRAVADDRSGELARNHRDPFFSRKPGFARGESYSILRRRLGRMTANLAGSPSCSVFPAPRGRSTRDPRSLHLRWPGACGGGLSAAAPDRTRRGTRDARWPTARQRRSAIPSHRPRSAAHRRSRQHRSRGTASRWWDPKCRESRRELRRRVFEMGPAQRRNGAAGREAGRSRANELIPARYQDVEQRLHSVAVSPEQQHFEFDLKSH